MNKQTVAKIQNAANSHYFIFDDGYEYFFTIHNILDFIYPLGADSLGEDKIFELKQKVCNHLDAVSTPLYIELQFKDDLSTIKTDISPAFSGLLDSVIFGDALIDYLFKYSNINATFVINKYAYDAKGEVVIDHIYDVDSLYSIQLADKAITKDPEAIDNVKLNIRSELKKKVLQIWDQEYHFIPETKTIDDMSACFIQDYTDGFISAINSVFISEFVDVESILHLTQEAINTKLRVIQIEE